MVEKIAVVGTLTRLLPLRMRGRNWEGGCSEEDEKESLENEGGGGGGLVDVHILVGLGVGSK